MTRETFSQALPHSQKLFIALPTRELHSLYPCAVFPNSMASQTQASWEGQSAAKATTNLQTWQSLLVLRLPLSAAKAGLILVIPSIQSHGPPALLPATAVRVHR